MKVARAQEMRHIDDYAIHHLGIPGIVLMENAAMAVVSETIGDARKYGPVLICCGIGNNGGDGFAIARILSCNHIPVTIAVIGNEEMIKGDARVNYEVAQKLHIPMIHCREEDDLIVLEQLCKEAGLIYDGIFGTGLCRSVEGIYQQAINCINRSDAYIVAIDIPSGVHGDLGQVLGVAVRARRTITFCLPKVGLLLYPGTDYVGELVVADIGIPHVAIEEVGPRIMCLDDQLGRGMFPRRYRQSHKGTYGKVLVIGGTGYMAGAAVMTTLAAYRTGTGLVKAFIQEEIASTLLGCVPEAIVETYKRQGEALDEGDIQKLLESLQWADGVAIGPGLGNDAITRQLLEIVMKHYTGTLVIDADGLNALAKDLTILEESSCQIILTPHIGEMARLTGQSMDDITTHLTDVAKSFTESHHVVLVLKSARTLVSAREKDTCINLFGNAGMATAGSGDVLTGVITSLIAQGLEPYESATLGVYIHSKAGDLGKKDLGEYSLMATDLIRYIPEVMK